MLLQPCYQINGKLWHVPHTPRGEEIAYHCALNRDAIFSLWQWYPQHIVDAILNYHDTIHALLSSGI